MTGDPRVVMFVMNTIEFDRRVLREASALASEGLEVTVVGIRTDERLPAVESRPEGFTIRRIPIPWRPMTVAPGTRDSTSKANGPVSDPKAPGNLHWLVRSRFRWWRWRQAAVRLAPKADVYHGHDLPGLGTAIAARRFHGAGRVVYDSHDLFVEAGANAHRPPWAKAALAMVERQWYDEADHVITVNRGIADELHARYGDAPTSVIHNCVPRWNPTTEDRSLLRSAAGIGPDVPLVLYHGGFSANRGLGLLIQAVGYPQMRDAHLVFLGYGPMEHELRRLADGAAVRGRVHVLDPVPPELLDAHVAGADVVAVVNQPVSQNEILSTPNKLFEALGAGVPVVTSDFSLRREIVMDHVKGPLGAVCDPVDSASIASAIASIIRRSPAERELLRGRCLDAAHRRWNWEAEERTLRDAYRSLLDGVTAPMPAASHA